MKGGDLLKKNIIYNKISLTYKVKSINLQKNNKNYYSFNKITHYKYL